MSKQKVIVLAVRDQGLTVADAARRYGVSRRWVHELLRCEATGGDRGRRAPIETASEQSPPHRGRRQSAYPGPARETTDRRLDAWHLNRERHAPPSTSTIRRILHAAGLIRPEPRKRPRASLRRFEAHQPNETWQSDSPTGPWRAGDIEILNFLEDHSRYLLAGTAYRPVTVTAVVATFFTAAAEYGLPASTLTDNGMVYTPPASPEAGAGGTPSNTNSTPWASPRRTAPETAPRPKARLNGSTKP